MNNETLYKKAVATLKPNKKPVKMTLANDGLHYSSETGLAKQLFYDFNTELEARKFRRQEYLGLKSLPFCNEHQSKRLAKLTKLVVRDNHVAFEADKARRGEV